MGRHHILTPVLKLILKQLCIGLKIGLCLPGFLVNETVYAFFIFPIRATLLVIFILII